MNFSMYKSSEIWRFWKKILKELKEKYSKRNFVPINFVRTKALGESENKKLREETNKQNGFFRQSLSSSNC